MKNRKRTNKTILSMLARINAKTASKRTLICECSMLSYSTNEKQSSTPETHNQDIGTLGFVLAFVCFGLSLRLGHYCDK